MNIGNALAGGVAAVGGTMEKIGLDGVRSAIEESRQARLLEMQHDMKLRDDETIRGRSKEDAETERGRVAEFMKPQVSQPNGLIAAGAGANDADNAGADESIGRDVQNRERPATYQQGAQRAAMAGDLKSAGELEKLDNNDEKIKTANVIAEMRQKYNTDRLTQQGQMALMKLAAAIAKGAHDGKLPADAQMIEYLVKEGVVKDRAAGAEWVKQGKASDPSYITTETESLDDQGNKKKTTVKSKPGAAQPAQTRKVVKFGDLK